MDPQPRTIRGPPSESAEISAERAGQKAAAKAPAGKVVFGQTRLLLLKNNILLKLLKLLFVVC